jgi:Spy/CpxP family protein refolding chaperone
MMTTFRKRLLIGMMALGLGAGAVAAYAAGPGCGPMGDGPAAFGGHGRSPERMKEYFEKRQSELHTKLKLNANQESAWNAYIGKIRPTGQFKRPDRAEMDKLSAPERMEKMLGFMKEGETHLADRIAATKEFYAVLTPEQQKIFNDEFKPGHMRHRGAQ